MIALHLGAHKTASTHLQHSLRNHRGRLAGSGVRVIGPDESRAAPLNLLKLAECGPTADAAGLQARVAGARSVVISDENLLGTAHAPAMFRQRRFYPRAEARLQRFLGASGLGEVTLYLAVRDPAGFLVSAYSQRLYGGQVEDFAEFLDGLDPAALRWSELVDRLMAVAGVAGAVVWPYEDYPEVLPAVLARMLPDALGRTVPPAPGIAHPGLSAAAHAWVMAETAAGKAPAGLARQARERFPKSAEFPAFAPLDAETLAASARAYAEDLVGIGAMARITVLRAASAKG